MENYETVDYEIFENFTNRWKEENESIIYEIGLFLMRVTHFAMTAFLVVHVIS